MTEEQLSKVMSVHYELTRDTLDEALKDKSESSKILLKYYGRNFETSYKTEQGNLNQILSALEYNVDDIKLILSTTYLRPFSVCIGI